MSEQGQINVEKKVSAEHVHINGYRVTTVWTVLRSNFAHPSGGGTVPNM